MKDVRGRQPSILDVSTVGTGIGTSNFEPKKVHQKIWHSGICSFQWPQLSKNYPPWWGAELASSAGKTLHSFKLQIKAIPWGRWSHLCWPFKSLQELLYNIYTSICYYDYSNCNNDYPKKCENSLLTNSMTCIHTAHKVYSFGFPAWFCIFGLPWIGRMLPDMLPVSELISMWHRIKEATNLQGRIGSVPVMRWRREDSSFRVSEASKSLDWYKLGVGDDSPAELFQVLWNLSFIGQAWISGRSLEICDLIRPFALAAPLSSSTGEKGWEVARTRCWSYKLSPEASRC